MKTKICIVCPQGCHINYTQKDGKVITAEGNNCKRGIPYIEQELLMPMRNLSTVVKIKSTSRAVCPVNTKAPIPKDEMNNLIKKLDEMVLNAPVKQGDIVLEYFKDAKIEVIVSCDID